MQLFDFLPMSKTHLNVSKRFLALGRIPIVIEKDGLIVKKLAYFPESTLMMIRATIPEVKGYIFFIRTSSDRFIIENAAKRLDMIYDDYKSKHTGYLHLVLVDEPKYG